MPRHLAALLVSLATAIPLPVYGAAAVLPAGTGLEARLSVSTGSRISKPGDPVHAIIIAPVFAGSREVISQGAVLSGVVASVERLGFGLKHLRSAIEYRFEAIQLSDGTTVPIQARVTRVETAKEHVSAQGVIGGIYPTVNLSSTVAVYGLPLLCVDPEFGLPFWGMKFVLARSPDPEIYFPAGTEILLRLTSDIALPALANSEPRIAALSDADLETAQRILAGLPQQTSKGRSQPSDLVNILLLGSRESMNRAFRAAGWSGAQRSSVMSFYRVYHSMVQRMGYSTAPMAKLTLNGVPAQAEYQKSLDTFSRRHHLRLWRQDQGNAWLGAATEDIGYQVHNLHLTHATDALIDNERAKVLNDLALTGCLEAGTLLPRASLGQPLLIQTDGRIAIIRINECLEPQTMPAQSSPSGPERQRRAFQALRALGTDVLRSNPVSLASNTMRLLHQTGGAHQSAGLTASVPPPQQKQVDNSSDSAWMRPSVLESPVTSTSAARSAPPLPRAVAAR